MLAKAATDTFPVASGEMALLIRGFDWSTTPLGQIDRWPQSLKTAIEIILRSPVPMVTLWGPPGIMIYNDAYSVFAGGRHPKLLGSKVLEGWPEVADLNRRVMDVGLRGETLSFRNEHLVLYRPGRPQDVWVDLDYSPLLDEHGRPAGVLAVVVETTERVRAEKALRESQAELARVQQIGKVGGVEVYLVGGFRNRRSAEYLAIHGLPPEGTNETHEGWVRRLHPEDRERTERQFLDAVRSDVRDYNSVYRIIRPNDGQVRWISVKAEIERDAEGRAIRLVGAHIDITDSKVAEQALRESEQRFRLVSESAPVMLWMGDAAGKCLYLNRTLREFWGVAEQDVASFDWNATLHPDDAATLFAAAGPAMERHQPFTAEARYRRFDGECRLVRTDAQPRFGPSGEFLGMIGVNVDVTDARHSEIALKESEERFRLIANSAPVPMWVSRLDGRRAFVNQAYMDFLGQSYEDCLVYDWRKALHPEDLTRILQEQKAGETSRKLFALEARYRRGDGQWRWLRSESQPRWGPDGEHIGFIGVAHDITAAKRAEIELRGLNETLEAQVEARTRERDRIWNVSQDLLVVADARGIWRNVNPAATAVLGWSSRELLGKSSEWLEHPEDAERTRAEQAHLAAGGRTMRFENRLRHKDGTYRWLSWTAVFHEGLIYATARDISEEKLAEEALRRTEEALRQAQKMEAVGQLTGGIAHDFNNLLQGIIGSLDRVQARLAEGRLSETQRYISGAMTSANRAAALTHRLLAFSRRQPLDPKLVKANPLIVSIEDLLRRTLGEKIELRLELAADLWPTICDQNQLENSILNLSINARDAMPDGGKLTIETGNADLLDSYKASSHGVAPGQYICVAVTDTGIGMTPDVIARAFDPFFTTKPTGQGTGLGLSMIYGFARQSDGYAKITSETGRGTTVRLYLPRHQGQEEEDAAPDPAGASDQEGGGQTVLVVEDEPLVRMLIVDVLNELGYSVLEAGDGPSGLRILQSSKSIDLLITDIGLPGLNGRQIADAARVTRPDLKVLFMTGYAESAAIADGVLAPGMQMITKPFVIDVLTNRIRDLMITR
jgi:PAS domain S-box-containing protein